MGPRGARPATGRRPGAGSAGLVQPDRLPAIRGDSGAPGLDGHRGGYEADAAVAHQGLDPARVVRVDGVVVLLAADQRAAGRVEVLRLAGGEPAAAQPPLAVLVVPRLGRVVAV